MAFDPAALAVVESFAAQLGLPARSAPDGSFGFVFARIGTLTLTPVSGDRRMVISLARKSARIEPDTLHRLLGVGGFHPVTDRMICAGLASDNEMHLAISLDQAQLDLPLLNDGFQDLVAAFDRIS